jgi:hypothetical protein
MCHTLNMNLQIWLISGLLFEIFSLMLHRSSSFYESMQLLRLPVDLQDIHGFLLKKLCLASIVLTRLNDVLIIIICHCCFFISLREIICYFLSFMRAFRSHHLFGSSVTSSPISLKVSQHSAMVSIWNLQLEVMDLRLLKVLCMILSVRYLQICMLSWAFSGSTLSIVILW